MQWLASPLAELAHGLACPAQKYLLLLYLPRKLCDFPQAFPICQYALLIELGLTGV